jgi:hypothetical protein
VIEINDEIIVVDQGDDAYLLIEPDQAPILLFDEEGDAVLLGSNASSDAVIVDAVGFIASYRTHLTEFVADTVYVGTAPRGADETAPLWLIYKIVESDDHPLKVPDVDGPHAWSDRLTLTYAAA